MTAGLTSFTRFPYGWMSCFHSVAAFCSARFDCPDFSGSLKPRMRVEPELRAFFTRSDDPLAFFASVRFTAGQRWHRTS
jgi:hypothetical protein